MDDLVRYYEECGRQDQSENFNDSNHVISVIELTKERGTDQIDFKILKLSGDAKTAWLTAEAPTSTKTVVLQLLQIPLEPASYSGHRHLNISQNDYHSTIRKFGLRGLVKYGTSATQVFNQVSEKLQDSTCIYSTTHIDDYFTVFHKNDSRTGVTQGLYWAGSKILPYLEKAILHQRELADHAFFLNLCTTAAFGAILDSRLATVSDEMARIERRTGFKAWDLGRYKPAHGDSYALSATASGYATTLAAFKRLNRLVESILKCYQERTAAADNNVESIDYKISNQVDARVKLLLQDNHTRQILIEYLTTRLQNQLKALFNLITQTDTRITISLAKDSRTIASASKHDSSSMKALAAVTVLFLPGTFISSLFSTQMFDWQAIEDSAVLSKRFWIYWATTLPLTFVTIFSWLVWTKMEDYWNQVQVVKEWEEPPDEKDPSV